MRVIRVLVLVFMKVFWERKETGTTNIKPGREISSEVHGIADFGFVSPCKPLTNETGKGKYEHCGIGVSIYWLFESL